MIGSVMFMRSSSPISWIIRKVTRSEWSHTAISISDDNSWIIEADALKRIKPKPNRYKEYEIVDICTTDQQKLMLLQFLLKQTDVPYDYRRIIGILLYLIGLTKNDNLWNTTNRTICNELISEGYRHIGIDFGKAITPADLANLLLGRKSICKSQ